VPVITTDVWHVCCHCVLHGRRNDFSVGGGKIGKKQLPVRESNSKYKILMTWIVTHFSPPCSMRSSRLPMYVMSPKIFEKVEKKLGEQDVLLAAPIILLAEHLLPCSPFSHACGVLSECARPYLTETMWLTSMNQKKPKFGAFTHRKTTTVFTESLHKSEPTIDLCKKKWGSNNTDWPHTRKVGGQVNWSPWPRASAVYDPSHQISSI